MEGSWGETMAQALIDAGMERARIGVSGLGRGFYTHGRAFHGVVNHSSYAEVLTPFAQRQVRTCTDVDRLCPLRQKRRTDRLPAPRRGDRRGGH